MSTHINYFPKKGTVVTLYHPIKAHKTMAAVWEFSYAHKLKTSNMHGMSMQSVDKKN